MRDGCFPDAEAVPVALNPSLEGCTFFVERLALPAVAKKYRSPSAPTAAAAAAPVPALLTATKRANVRQYSGLASCVDTHHIALPGALLPLRQVPFFEGSELRLDSRIGASAYAPKPIRRKSTVTTARWPQPHSCRRCQEFLGLAHVVRCAGLPPELKRAVKLEVGFGTLALGDEALGRAQARIRLEEGGIAELGEGVSRINELARRVEPQRAEQTRPRPAARRSQNRVRATQGTKIASSASKSPRRQASNPCCATVRLEL